MSLTLVRFGRLLLIGLVTQPVVAALVASSLARWPLVAAVVAVVETAIVAAFKPVEVTSEPAPAQPPGGAP